MLFLAILFLIPAFSLAVAMIGTPEALRSLQEFILRFHGAFVNTLALEVVPIVLICLTCVVYLVYMNCVRRGVIHKFQESRDPGEVNGASSKQMGLLKEKKWQAWMTRFKAWNFTISRISQKAAKTQKAPLL